MKRTLQLAVLVSCASFTASAQDLAYKIPEKAFTVASIKSNQLLQLSAFKEFNSSSWGKKVLDKLSASTEKKFNSVEELGVNLSADIYYYYQPTDSISQHGILIPLADASKIEALFSKHADKIQRSNGINVLQHPDSKSILSWNNELLYISYGSLNTQFFSDSAHAAQYGISTSVYDEYYPSAEDADAVTAPAFLDSVAMADSTDIVAADTAMAPISLPTQEDVPPPPVLPEQEIQMEEETQDEYVQTYEEKKKIKDSLVISWLTIATHEIFNKTNTTPSILNNRGYQRSADKNAIATFWMTDIQSIYTSFFPYYFMKYGYMMQGYGSFNARLYMEKEQMRITGEMGLDEQKSAVYKNICAQKLNKKFLKYIKSDSLIGFMSYAFNTEAYMNELPRLFTGMYGKYEEEMALAGDFLSLMLDEKAVAKVVKGDALFLMTNVSQKEVSYKSYSYDEETYEYKDTVLTKTETLPDFLFMFSSDDTKLIEKLLQYGIKKEKILLNNGIYSVGQSRKNPFSLHMLIKDGIVFLGTSLQEIRQIHDGSFKGNLDKQQKELLTKNNMTMFLNPRNLGRKIPAKELGDINSTFRKLMGGAGNIYMTTAGINNGYIAMDMIADVPKEKENALQYFLDMMEDLDKLK
jgi:hypothetical protein